MGPYHQIEKTMNQPLCSIVVPTFNRSDIVVRTLNSIYAQEYRPISLIIVDNNSADNTLEVLDSWSRHHNSADFNVTMLSESKPGAAAARNKGLAIVDTPYVMFFDSDDIMAPGHLASVMSAITRYNYPDIIGWDVIIRHLNGKSQTVRFPESDYFFRHFFNSILATQRYAVKTELIRQCGAWNENLPGWNDYELGMRLLLSRPAITKVHTPPQVTVLRQSESITGTLYSQKCDYWEKCLDKLKQILPQKYHKGIELRRMVLAALYHRENSPESQRLRHEVISSCRSTKDALLLQFAYLYTALHGRGIHCILRPFLGF